MGREKRRFIRLPVEVDFSVRDGNGEHGQLFFAGRNVSLGGAFLASEILFDLGSLLHVVFKLPDHPLPIQAEAVVAWVSDGEDAEAGMGIAFEAVGPHSMRAIEQFVAKNAQYES